MYALNKYDTQTFVFTQICVPLHRLMKNIFLNFLTYISISMKRLSLLFALLWGFSSMLSAQPYGNEWIDYSKNYYKFKVKDDGIIRIPYSTLAGAGFAGSAGSGFKVFYKGQELPIFVTTNNAIGAADYIEFYGKGNDGELDTQLFAQSSWQLHNYKSSFSDTISYFLVWDNVNPGQRIQQTNNDLTGAPAAEPYFMHVARNIHWNIFNSGTPFRLGGANNNYPDFENGEGFLSQEINTGANYTTGLSTPSKYTAAGAPSATLKSKIVGRSNDFPYLPDHHTSVLVGGTEYANIQFEGYESQSITRLVFLSNISSPQTQVTYTSLADISDIDKIAIAYTELTYPRQFDFGGSTKFYFSLNDNDLTYLEIGNFNGGSNPVLYDLTNNRRVFPIFEGGVYKVLLQPGTNPSITRRMYLSNMDNVCLLNSCTTPACVNSCDVWTVSQLIPANFTNLTLLASQGNYLLITHPSLRAGTTDWVAAYAAHRNSAAGGSHVARIVNIEELYDQFAWGVPKHPLSIRNFINYAKDNWIVNLQYVFLVGKSVSYESVTNNPLAFSSCLVPTWGHHPSDNMLAVRDFSTYIPQVPIGRLSAKNPAEVEAYYEKMVAYDSNLNCTLADRQWTKNVIHVANGHNVAEMNQYLGYVNSYKATVEAPLYAGTVVGTYTQSGFTAPPQPGFTAAMNNGASVVTLMGHSVNANTYNFDLKQPEEYTNNFKNPLMIAGSCFVGDIHSYGASNQSLAEKFVLIPEKGAIGFLATVSFGFPEFLQEFGDSLYREFSYLTYNQPIGRSINNAMNHIYISDPANSRYQGIKITLQEYTLEGDPAFVLVGAYNNPEYLINTPVSNNIKVFDTASGTELTGSPIVIVNPAVNVQVTVSNVGQGYSGNLQITVQQQLPGGGTVPVGQAIVPAPLTSQTFTIPAVLNGAISGVGSLIITLNPTGEIIEDCSFNNQGTVPIQIQSTSCVGLPLPTITGLSSVYCGDAGAIALSANPTGGTFTINGTPATSFNPTLLGPGAHVVQYEYTDTPTGCLLNAAQTVTVNAVPSSAFTVSASNICLTDGQVTISANNVMTGATYSWGFSDGNIVSLGNQTYEVSWSTAGTKVITLTATANGCVSSQETFTVTVESPLAQPIVTCGASTTESVSFVWPPVAGSTGYQVVINGIPSTIAGTTYTQSGLAFGESVSIQVTALGTGICGNSLPSSPVACTAQNCPPLTLTVENVLSSYCVNGSSTTFNGIPTGGSFLLNGSPAPATFDPSESGVGSYTLEYITTIGGCDYSSQIYTFNVVAAPSPTITGDAIICPGTGTTISANTGFATYLWSTGATNAAISVTPTVETTYTVTVTNADGCIGTAQFTVTPAPTQSLDITTGTGNTTICNGEILSLTASNGFAEYQWGGLGFGQSVTIASSGTYSVTATDDFGCNYTASIVITPISITTPTILANNSSQTDFCSDIPITLSAGTGYSSYMWSTGATTPTISATGSGLYSVTVSNAEGCEANASLNINVTEIQAPVIEASTLEICDGETAILNASGGFTSYEWSNGAFGSTIMVDEVGTYSVTVTLNDCQASSEITISYSEGAIPEAGFSVLDTPSVCVGSTIRLVNESSNASSYLWTFTNTETGETSTTAEIEPIVTLEPGTYTVSLVATAECGTATDESVLTNYLSVYNSPSVEVITLPTTVCPGDDVLLEGQSSANSVQWFAGEAPISSNLTVNVNPNFETVYTLIATNTAGCSAADSVLISINEVCELSNAITPNNDGFNDTWMIPQAQSNPNIIVTIFNRWGQEVYSNSAYDNGNGWNGTNNDGTELPSGTYYYVIDLNDGTEPLSGHITLLL